MRMIMKSAVVLIATIALASCYWTPQDETSTIELRFSGSDVSGQGAQLQAVAEGSDTVRIYLVVENGSSRSIVQLGGGDTYYREVSLGSGSKTVTIDQVAAGRTYRLYVAAGTEVVDGSLDTVEYYESDTFTPGGGNTVTFDTGNADGTGASGSVALNRYDTGFLTFADLRANRVNGVVYAGSDLHASTASSVRIVNADGTIDGDPYGFSGGTGPSINSISRGSSLAEPVLVNTTNGIYGIGTSLLERYSPDGIDRSVLQSIEIGYVGQELSSSFSLIYQTSSGIGGVSSESGAGSTDAEDWFFEDLQDVISGAPVRDLDISSGSSQAAFLATKLGTFIALPDQLDDLSSDSSWTEVQERLGLLRGMENPVLSLSFDGTETLFLGTRGGAWTVDVNLDRGDFVENTISQVSGTAGTIVTDISVLDSDTYAFLTPFFVIVSHDGDLVRIPFAAGLPGEPTSMAWQSGTTLAVGGTEGLVLIDITGAIEELPTQ